MFNIQLSEKTEDGLNIIELSKEMSDRIKNLAIRTGRPRDALLRGVLENCLEDYADDLLAIDEYEKGRNNGTLQTCSLEDMKKKCGLV